MLDSGVLSSCLIVLYLDYRLYKGDAEGITGGLLSKSDPSQLDRERQEISSDQDQDQDQDQVT